MPNRLLKDGICTSETINKIQPLAETFFYRLLTVSDDFGRMDARPSILKSTCFPLKDSITPSVVSELLSELADAPLLFLYEVSGKPFIQILKWEQRVRSKGKYPAPVSNPLSVDSNVRTDDGLGVGLGLGVGEGGGNGSGLGLGVPRTATDKARQAAEKAMILSRRKAALP